MALRAVPEHPKFADLKARLDRPKYVTLGMKPEYRQANPWRGRVFAEVN